MDGFSTGNGSRNFSRRSIHGRIAHELGQQILHGDLAPGEILPSETALGQLRDKLRMLGAGDVIVHQPHAGFVRLAERV